MHIEKSFSDLVLSFPNTEMIQHFNKLAFRITKKKIFASYDFQNNLGNVLLNPKAQATYCSYTSTAIYPVPNKWGAKGWTTLVLDELPVKLIQEVINSAYQQQVSPKNI